MTLRCAALNDFRGHPAGVQWNLRFSPGLQVPVPLPTVPYDLWMPRGSTKVGESPRLAARAHQLWGLMEFLLIVFPWERCA